MIQTSLDFGVAAGSDYDDDGHLQIQTDSPGVDGKEGTQPAEALAVNGVRCRPLDPDKGGSAADIGLGEGLLIIRVGDVRYAIPIGDPRDVADGKVPKQKKGGRQLVGGAGDYRSFVDIDGEDPAGKNAPGSIMISASYAKDGAKKSLGLSFNVRESGKEDISLVHGEGARITVGPKGTTVTSPNGKSYVEVGTKGNVLAGKTKVQGSLTVGAQAAAFPVIKGPEFVAFMTQLISIIVATGPSASGAPAGALVGQLQSLLTQHFKSS